MALGYNNPVQSFKGGIIMSSFYWQDPRDSNEIEAAFVRKLREKYEPIGCPEEFWYVICDPAEMLIDHHQFILVFSDEELVKKFFLSVTGLPERGCWIRKFKWKEIVRFCKYKYQGVVVDWLVRENFSFHGLD